MHLSIFTNAKKLLSFLFCISYSLFLISCSLNRQISRQAEHYLIKDPALSTANIGISIYEPATGKFLYDHNAEKLFTPASNTKLFTLYAGLKYLEDSLPGIKIFEYKDKIFISGTGDPTLLHPDFPNQPVLKYLSTTNKTLWGGTPDFKTNAYGKGWAWDDYNGGFMRERSALPIYGNAVIFSGSKDRISYSPKGVVDSVLNSFSTIENGAYLSKVTRAISQNNFSIFLNGREKMQVAVPFITSASLAFKLLSDTLHKHIVDPGEAPPAEREESPKIFIIRSRPADSLFKPMMVKSDNILAEQLLLMISNELLGYMNETATIDTLLKKDFAGLPQTPVWVDGSGLSRYNLFSPRDFVFVLDKIRTEFGLERLRNILPTGGQGTLKNYYLEDSTFIYAKTGSMSNVMALSGFLISKKNKLLAFSILVNNYQPSGETVRRAVEKFVKKLRADF